MGLHAALRLVHLGSEAGDQSSQAAHETVLGPLTQGCVGRGGGEEGAGSHNKETAECSCTMRTDLAKAELSCTQ